jgi:tetratricopeptide (TPR) repeat protein
LLVRLKAFFFTVAVVVLAACTGSEAQKTRLVETGNKYYDAGKYKEASLIYRKAIQRDARYGEAYYRLGLNELKLGRFGDALRALRRAAELQPNNEDAHSKLGDLYLSVYLSDKKKYKDLLSEFGELADAMLKRNAKSFDGLRMKGFQYVAEEKLPEAIEYFEKADAVKSGDERLNLALIQSLAAGGQRDVALAKANAFIAKNKTFGAMYDFIYVQHLAVRDVAGAEKVLREKQANNPKQVMYLIELAAHYAKTGKPAESRATLDKIVADKKNFPDGRITVGDFYYRLQDFPSAQKEFEAGMKELPDQKATFQKRIVEMLAIQGRRKEALEMAEKLVAEFGNDSEAKAIRASLRMRGGTKTELAESVKELQSVIGRMPDNPVVRFNLGEALAAQGEIEQAKIQFGEAIKLRANYMPPRLSLARIYLSSGEYARAGQLADEILANTATDLRARLLKATALMGTNELLAARTELGKVLTAEPENRDAIYLISNLNYAEKKYADAEQGFRKLYSMTPSDIRGLFGLAEMAMVAGKPAEARALLEKELPAAKDKTSINLALANVFVRANDYENAIRIYKPLIAASPENADYAMRLGEVYLRAEKLDESRQYFEKAKQLAPKNVIPLLKLGTIYERKGERALLMPTYEAILKIEPDNPLALNNMAYHLAESGGDLDQALTLAQRAKQQMPTNNDVADTLGWIYIKKNLSDDAIKIFRDLLGKDPNRVAWRYHLAMALFQKGDKLEARKEVDRALGAQPSAEESKNLKDLLSRIG